MKNKILAVLLILAMVLGLSSFATDIKVDGKISSVATKQTDGRLLIKLDDFAKFGLKTETSGNQAILSNRNVKMTFEVSKNTVKVNNITVSLDAPIQKLGQDIYLPARFVMETLNYDVTWNAKTKMMEAKIKQTNGYPISLKLGEDEFRIDKAPEKVVSMAPSVTERIFDLGLGSLLVGRTKYCTYPKAALQVTEIGSLYTPDIEKIISLKPDVVICETHFKPEVLEKFREAGIKIVAKSSPKSIEGIYEYTEFLGRVFNKQYEARALVAASKAKVTTVEYVLSQGKNSDQRVYYSTSSGEYGEYGAPDNSFLGELIGVCGGKNIMKAQWKEKDVVDWAYTVEDIIKNDPQVVFGGLAGAGTMKSNSLFQGISAVKNQKVYVDEEELFSRPTHRLLDEGLKKLLGYLHPEVVSKLNF